MKKIGILLSMLIFCSCSLNKKYNYKINTIIEENTNTLIAINYPVTNIKKINKSIKKFINNTYKEFLNEYNTVTFLNKKHELNIDYDYYNLSNQYISICLYKHISSSNNDFIINELYNYVYDIKNNKKINFKNIIDNNNSNSIKDLIYNLLLEKYGNIININKLLNIDYDNLNFIINNKYITLLFEGIDICDNYNEIIKLDIPITFFDELNGLVSEEEFFEHNITPTINYIDISKPIVALTFDDGPSIYTSKILDTLEKYDSNATFFVLGNKVEDHQDTIVRMYQNGNEIGNHSYNHRWLTRLSLEGQREQIDKTQEIIKKYTGYTPIYLRPTYGSSNKKLKGNTNLEIVFWTIDTKDWKYKNVDTIVDNALKGIKDGSIILMHDTYKRTDEAVQIIVPKLIEKGYQLVTVSELKEVQKIKNTIHEE